MSMRCFKFSSSQKVRLKETEILCHTLIICLLYNRRANHLSNIEEHRFLRNVKDVLDFHTRQTAISDFLNRAAESISFHFEALLIGSLNKAVLDVFP